MTDQDRIANGEAASLALERWLSPAIDAITGQYLESIVRIGSEPWDKYQAAKLEKLATATKIAREVRKQIEAVVHDGQLALQTMRMNRPIENMDVERKKVLGIYVPKGVM